MHTLRNQIFPYRVPLVVPCMNATKTRADAWAVRHPFGHSISGFEGGAHTTTNVPQTGRDARADDFMLLRMCTPGGNEEGMDFQTTDKRPNIDKTSKRRAESHTGWSRHTFVPETSGSLLSRCLRLPPPSRLRQAVAPLLMSPSYDRSI